MVRISLCCKGQSIKLFESCVFRHFDSPFPGHRLVARHLLDARGMPIGSEAFSCRKQCLHFIGLSGFLRIENQGKRKNAKGKKGETMQRAKCKRKESMTKIGLAM